MGTRSRPRTPSSRRRSPRAASYRSLALLLAAPQRAAPRIRAALADTREETTRLRLALALAVTGDDGAASPLLERLAVDRWDEGWNYRGMGQFGMSLSELDRVIVALSIARVRAALPRIRALAEMLDAEHAFSHHRAAAIACETFADPEAAPVLARALRRPGMRGHAFRDVKLARDAIPAAPVENAIRNVALRELHLASALYRCGDEDGLGRSVLEEYAADYRGCFARHARGVLAGEPPREAEPVRPRSAAGTGARGEPLAARE